MSTTAILAIATVTAIVHATSTAVAADSNAPTIAEAAPALAAANRAAKARAHNARVVERARKRVREAAEEEEEEEDGPWTFDWAVNPWRFKRGDPGTIEMLLPCGRITQISAHRHDDIKLYPWCSSVKSNTTYVITGFSVKGKQTWRFLHAILNDQFLVRDHINGQGLDNRDENIREGSGGINQFNRKLKTDGVTRDPDRPRWVARWVNPDKTRGRKYFPFGRCDAAAQQAVYEMAVTYRKQMAEPALAAAFLPSEEPIQRVTAKGLRPPLFTGINFRKTSANGTHLRARTMIDGQEATASWHLSQFADEELVLSGVLHEADFAMDAAMTWYLETNSKMRRAEWQKKKKQRQQQDEDAE